MTVPVLAIHETGDGSVPWSLQQSYRRWTLAVGTGHLLVQQAVRWPGRCAFDGEVREQAFDDVVARGGHVGSGVEMDVRNPRRGLARWR